jgi:hypothetical protein
MCIVQSHEIKSFFYNQELNRWWLRNIRGCCKLVSYGPQVLFRMGVFKVKKGLGEHVWLVLSQATPLFPPCWRVSTSCRVCPCLAWLWYEPTMFYILLFLSLWCAWRQWFFLSNSFWKILKLSTKIANVERHIKMYYVYVQ